MKHVAEYRRLKSGRVGIYQYKKGRIREQERAALQEGEDAVFDLPDLTFRASPVGWGIHDNGVVVAASSDFALDKFAAVIHQSAYGRLAKPGELGVLSCPADHALGGIHMRDLGARRGGRCRSTAGVGKKIEDTYIFAGSDTIADEL